MSRTTLKDLQTRLDEMREQRDDARRQLQSLKEDAANSKLYRTKADRAILENGICHDLLNAYITRDITSYPLRAGAIHCAGSFDFSPSPRPLPQRLAGLIASVCVQEGRLLQADLIRQEALNTKPSEAL